MIAVSLLKVQAQGHMGKKKKGKASKNNKSKISSSGYKPSGKKLDVSGSESELVKRRPHHTPPPPVSSLKLMMI